MFIKKLYSWLFPAVCLLCGQYSDREHDLCDRCFAYFPTTPFSCKRCAISLPVAAEYCGQCLIPEKPYSVTFTLYAYKPPIDTLLLELKFKQSLMHAKLFGKLMSQKILSDWYKDQPLPELILPIPLHAKRMQERGYNQALEIAKIVAKDLAIPLDRHHVKRIKHTAPQATLHAKQREQNLAHAFITTRDWQGKHIAVLDDVITTGHTVTALCRLLKQNNAGRVDVWCCARA